MLKNYITVAFRNLVKHLSYTFINVFGLALGLVTCLLLLTWIFDELSFDQFHTRSNDIYRVSMEMQSSERSIRTSVSPTALLPQLMEFPEVETGTRVYNPSGWNAFIVRKDQLMFQESKFYFADSTFFDVFTFELLSGNENTALRQPNSVVLTQSSAKKYFGEENPLGKTININNADDYTVTGVIADPPNNSTLRFDFIGSFISLPQAKKPIWWSANYQTYVVVHPNTDLKSLSEKTDQAAIKAVAGDLKGSDDLLHYNFMKFTDVHLKSPYPTEFEVGGNIQYVYIFSAVALLVLLIACINYINLATARAIERAKEVGIRKVAGAIRPQLIMQFMAESAMIVFVAFVLAFSAAHLLLPVFNFITDKELTLSVFYDLSFIAIVLLVLIGISVLAGTYPAIALTAFKPVSILKGNFKFSAKGIWLRKALVVAQFSISILLIIGTMVILKQLKFIQEVNLGYNKDRVLVMPLDDKTNEVYNVLATEFLKSGVAISAGRSTETPLLIKGTYGFNLQQRSAEEDLLTSAMSVDSGFLKTLNIEMLKGRNFSFADRQRVLSDTLYAFLINEAMMKELLLTADEAIGTKVSLSGRKGEIIGVIKDFHFSSLHHTIGPLVLFNQDDFNHYYVKLSNSDVSLALQTLKNISSEVAPHRPFEYDFLDQQYEAMYDAEQRMGSIITIFAALAIIIACLGLFGLVSFSASQKTKEIGIRKVLGATPVNIITLVTRDFSSLILIAILIGVPLSYYLMDTWLNDFAFRTNIGIWPVVIAPVLCITIAAITVITQALKAALLDPAQTLRSE